MTGPTATDVIAEAIHDRSAARAVVAAIRGATVEQLHDLRPDLLGAFCVAYDDETPHMDGPHIIRMGEFASIESAREALAVLTARSSRAPKRNARIEARVVGPWRAEP